MQQFDDAKGKGRFLNISNMKEEEAKEFFLQCTRMPKELQQQCGKELIKKISKLNKQEWILAIHSNEDNNLIGKIEVHFINEEMANLRIHIPSTRWKNKDYEIKAIDQFLKICRDNQYVKTIQLAKSDITEKYVKYHKLSSMNIDVV